MCITSLLPLAGLLSAAVCLGGTPAQASDFITIPSNPIPTAPQARPAPQPLTGRLSLPGHTGRYPVIIVLHGCGGIGNGANTQRWADRLNDWGYAALVLDSLAARHISSVCAPAEQPKVTPADRAGDVLNAALELSKNPNIDPRRIGVIGFSHGGGTAVAVTEQQFDSFSPGLIKASVNYYGPCRQPKLHGHTPLLSLNGDADTWGNPAKTCAAFLAEMHPDQNVELHTYPDVVHGFDNEDLTSRRTSLGHPIQYSWEYAPDSFKLTHVFLDRFVRDTH